jgi:hypothetical protein
MTLVFTGVLLVSAGVELLLTPLGDAFIRSLDGCELTVAGVVSETRASAECSEPEVRVAQSHKTSCYVLSTAGVVYPLADVPAAAAFVGKQVRIRGVLHQATGILEVRSIAPIVPARYSLDPPSGTS